MALGRLPLPNASAAQIDAAVLDATVKGVPAHAGRIRLDAIAGKS